MTTAPGRLSTVAMIGSSRERYAEGAHSPDALPDHRRHAPRHPRPSSSFLLFLLGCFFFALDEVKAPVVSMLFLSDLKAFRYKAPFLSLVVVKFFLDLRTSREPMVRLEVEARHFFRVFGW